MKYFIAIALIATVASAAIVKPTQVSGELAEIQEIVAAINSPSTNPATAAALEEMLWDVLGLTLEPVAVGPAIVPSPAIVAPTPVRPTPVATVPIRPTPVATVPVRPTPVATAPIAPSPVVIVPGPAADVDASSTPLVQLIVNINQAAAESGSVAPAPVFAPEAQPEPVHVVEFAPVQVVESAPVVAEPVQVVDVAPMPVQVVEVAPVPVEPVIIGTPVLPSPAINLPAELN